MFRRLSILILALAVFGLSMSSYAEQQFSFPYITPVCTPSPEDDGVNSSFTFDVKANNSENKGDSDCLTIYAPEGYSFALHWNVTPDFYDSNSGLVEGEFNYYSFTGKGRNTPSLKIPYSSFKYMLNDWYNFVVVEGQDQYGYSVALSSSFGSLTPSFPSWAYQFNSNSSGDISLDFVTRCLAFGSVLYVNIVDQTGHLVSGIEETPEPTPTPDPLETYRPSVDEEEGEAQDISGITSVISAVSSIISIVWLIFPYFTPIFIVLLIVLYLKVVL